MTVTSYKDLVNQLKIGKCEKFPTRKAAPVTDASFCPDLYWRIAGYPRVGAVPATGVGTVPTSATLGAIPFLNAQAGANKYLMSWGNWSSQIETFMIADLLWFNSGLNGTLTTAQTINSSALTRYTTGEGNWLGLVCWTATGTTAANVTTSYTNQAGTAGRTSVSVVFWTGGFGGGTIAPSADQMQFLPLQSGDYGVRSIETLTLSASTLTAGDFGACIIHPLVFITGRLDEFVERDYILQSNQLPEVVDNACLVFIGIPSSGTGSTMDGQVTLVEA